MTAEVVWTGPDELRPVLVPLRNLERHPRNPRRGQIALIADSLKRFGQVRPILTNGHVIVAGNHTFMAAEAIGWTHIAAIPNEFKDEAEAAAYLLADNRLPELGDYDRVQLVPLLEEIEVAGAWAGTGYVLDDLEDLRALMGQIPETEHQEFEGGFAVGDEVLADRQAQLDAGNSYRELVLTLTAEQSADYEAHLRVLRKEYDETGVSDIVRRSLAEQAALVE